MAKSPFLKPCDVTKNAGKIQNLLLQFGAEMSNVSGTYSQGGTGYENKDEIAGTILNANNEAYKKLRIGEREEAQRQEQYAQMQMYQQPVYQERVQLPMYQLGNDGMMPAYSMMAPQRTNLTIEEDMENIDISKYIGKPKENAQPSGDMGMLVKEIRETNKKLEAMCKILGLIYQQNMQNASQRAFVDDVVEEARKQFVEEEEPEMSIAEEAEMLSNLPEIPAVDPMEE